MEWVASCLSTFTRIHIYDVNIAPRVSRPYKNTCTNIFNNMKLSLRFHLRLKLLADIRVHCRDFMVTSAITEYGYDISIQNSNFAFIICRNTFQEKPIQLFEFRWILYFWNVPRLFSPSFNFFLVPYFYRLHLP